MEERMSIVQMVSLMSQNWDLAIFSILSLSVR